MSAGSRKITRSIGILMILVGLVLLGWFLWQYFGTNIVSKRAQGQIKKETIEKWKDGVDGQAIALLRVKRFGKDFEVPILKGWDDGTLAKGVGMYEKAEKPGAVGNFAIAGHRVTHGEPFRDFLKLRTGDRVVVETRTNIYTYKLQDAGDAITVDFTTAWPTFNVPKPGAEKIRATKPKLTMLTCSELFHTDNRNIVRGDLINVVDKNS